MKRIILMYNAVIVTILTVVGFFAAKTIPQLISSILFFPLAAYFWRMIIPISQRAIPVIATAVVPQKTSSTKKRTSKKQAPMELTPLEDITDEAATGKFDLNRRTFLRLIGSAGVSVFLLSIFTGKADAAFFGSVPGPGTVGVKDTSGNLIDPAEKKPTDGYSISQVDDAIPSYYGYVEKNGAWYIVKEDATGAFRYAKGSSSFSSNWTSRASLTYDYFNAVF